MLTIAKVPLWVLYGSQGEGNTLHDALQSPSPTIRWLCLANHI